MPANGDGAVNYVPLVYGILLLFMLLGMDTGPGIFVVTLATGVMLFLVQSRLMTAEKRIEALARALTERDGSALPASQDAKAPDAAPATSTSDPLAEPRSDPVTASPTGLRTASGADRAPPAAGLPRAPATPSPGSQPGPAPSPAPSTSAPISARDTGSTQTLPGAPPATSTRPGTGASASIETLVNQARAWLAGGNPLVRIGASLLLIGVAFLVNYLAERGVLPPAIRLALIMLGGIIVVVIGWILRARAGAYGLVLQGAGVAILYLSIFGGLRLYDLLSPTVAFSALIAITILANALAILQKAAPLALFATVGGFLAPILTSSGSGSHIALFSYYAILDVGILAIAWHQSWRLLNWIGFVFTFGVGAAWGLQEYQDAYYASAQAFLIFFVLLYVAVPVLYARRQPPQLRGVVDASLVFGVPTIAFVMQIGLVHDTEFGVAFSALAAAAMYASVATILWRGGGTPFALLSQTHIALGVTFATLALPFALDDASITGATWALEGAGLIWVGVRQHRRLPQFAGVALQLLAAMAIGVFMLGGASRGMDALPYLNGHFISVLMLGIGGVAGAAAVGVGRALVGWRRPERSEHCIPGLDLGITAAGIVDRRQRLAGRADRRAPG